MVLTSLWCPDGDHLVGLVQLTETLSEHLDVVSGVWFQHGQFVAGLVAVSVHDGPLLGAHEPGERRGVCVYREGGRTACYSSSNNGSNKCSLPVVYEEVAGVHRKVFGA